MTSVFGLCILLVFMPSYIHVTLIGQVNTKPGKQFKQEISFADVPENWHVLVGGK